MNNRSKKQRFYVEAGRSQTLVKAHRAQADWSISEFGARFRSANLDAIFLGDEFLELLHHAEASRINAVDEQNSIEVVDFVGRD